MIVSHYQKKKQLLFFCRSRPQPPSGKIDGPLLLPRMVTTSATISNGRCADWMEKADWILLTLQYVCISLSLYATICEDGPPRSQAERRGFAQLAVRSGLPLLICMTTIPLLVPMEHQKYISSPSECVSRQLVSFIAQKNPTELYLCCSLHAVKIIVGLFQEAASLPRPSCSCS
jgi:hypothetical protein